MHLIGKETESFTCFLDAILEFSRLPPLAVPFSQRLSSFLSFLSFVNKDSRT